MKKNCFILVWVFFLISCSSVPKEKSTLYGMVFDGNSQMLDGVQIFLDGKLVAISDFYGHFSIQNIRLLKHYKLEAAKKGYENSFIEFDWTATSKVVYVKINSYEQLLCNAENLLKNSYAQKSLELCNHILELLENENSIENISVDEVLFLKALCFYKLSDFKKSIEILLELLEKKSSSYVYLLLADNYEFGLSDYKKAKFYLEEFLKKSDEPEIRFRMENL